MTTWKSRLSGRMGSLGRSDVAAVLALAEQPDIVSFAGGLPDPATYLLAEVRQITEHVLREQGHKALGYGPAPGLTPLREWLARWMTARGRPTDAEETLVTTGGVAALDLIAKVFLDPGDVVLVGRPSYLAALHVFRSYGARLVGVPVDEHGLVPEALEACLRDLAAAGIRPKLLYTVPSFQNPSGVTLPEPRRRRMLELAREYDLGIVEDAAYRELRFEGVAPPLLAALDPDRVILIDTFSKIFNPGMRLGWVTAPRELIAALVAAKQGQDQCASTLAQYICLAFAERGFIERQLGIAVPLYRRKRDTMCLALEAHMPSGCTWTRPQGGFYVWLTLPEHLDSEALLPRAIADEKLAYVPGPAFFHDGTGHRHLRLCYSYVDQARIDDGIQRLGALLARL
jgi:2-aminoadipate transaminase